MLTADKKDSRSVGQEIELFDLKNMSKPECFGTAVITKITKKFIEVERHGIKRKFHRATGYMKGFHWPAFATAIRPETA